MIKPSDLDRELFGGHQKLNCNSFDSGYSASPTGCAEGTSIPRQSTGHQQVLNSINMDTSNFFITSPNKYSLNADMIRISPLKTEPVGFSPFKDSSLSPFKLINQSPSKGSFDDWDKNFIEGFEENLFGLVNDLPESTMEELLKSPKGKALLEKGKASVDLSISPAKNMRISSIQRPLTQEVEQRETTNMRIKQEQAELSITKQENIENDHMYGQTYVYVNTSGALSAIDPDKMSATPIKPRHMYMENAPKRKLAMKAPASVNPVQTITFNNDQGSQNLNVCKQPVWPSRERLNFARAQFAQALNKAVEREKQILRDYENINAQKSIPQPVQEKKTKVKAACGKSKKSAAGKSKGKARKGSKKDKYPEISMALSKPVTGGKRNRNSQRHDSIELAPDFDDYLDCTDDEYDDDVDGTAWNSRLPFYRQMSTGFNTYSDDTSDEEWTENGYKYQRNDGARVTMKKRRR